MIAAMPDSVSRAAAPQMATPSSKRGPTLLFVHGWAFDGSMWNALRALLPEWPHAVFDAGYFSHAAAPVPAGPVLAIAHSFGSLRVLANLPLGCEAIVFINGFTRFSAAADFPDGVPARALDRMLAKLPAQPLAGLPSMDSSSTDSSPTGMGGPPASSSKVVDDFRVRCGASAALAPLNFTALARDLQTLRDNDLRDSLRACPLPWRALAGGADPIVSPAMTRLAFDSANIVWRDRGGHLLPLSDPAWCAMHIRAFLHTLDHGPGRGA